MGLIRTALVFGAGYLAGRPDGLEQLRALRTKALALADRPEVKRARERAWDVAGDQALALKRRLPIGSGGGSEATGSAVSVSSGEGWHPTDPSPTTPAATAPAATDEPLSAADPTAAPTPAPSTSAAAERD